MHCQASQSSCVGPVGLLMEQLAGLSQVAYYREPDAQLLLNGVIATCWEKLLVMP